MVEFAFIDSGGTRTVEIQDWCRGRSGRVLPAAARDHRRLSQMYSYTNVDKKPNGKKVIGGLQQLSWSSAAVKDIVAAKMSILPGNQGAFEIPATVSKDYQKQLRSEYKDDKGYWLQIGKRPNHYWDCEALSFIAAITRGVANRASMEQHLSFMEKLREAEKEEQKDNRRMW